MKVLIYAGDGGSGGYLRYCTGLLCSGVSVGNLDLHVVCSPRMRERLATGADRFRVHTHDFIGCGSWIRRRIWHVFIYPRWDRAIAADADFYLSGYLPVFPVKVPNIVTCHNLLPFDIPEINRYSSSKDRRSLRTIRHRQLKSYNDASARIFLSDHSHGVISSQLKQRCYDSVIRHGIGVEWFEVGPKTFQLMDSIKVLYVSDIHPYKNHHTLIEAICRLRTSLRKDVHLYLAGGGNATEVSNLKRIVQNDNRLDFIHFLGTQNDRELRALYKTADAVAFPSSLECCPVTLLEAMASRVPIACSERSGLREVLCDGGIYFDPFDSGSVARALGKLLGSAELRCTLAERAYRRAGRFTWKSCADKTFAFIESIVINGGRSAPVS